jgi:hypothetical protein
MNRTFAKMSPKSSEHLYLVLLAKHKMSFVADPLKYEKHNKKIL